MFGRLNTSLLRIPDAFAGDAPPSFIGLPAESFELKSLNEIATVHPEDKHGPRKKSDNRKNRDASGSHV